MHASMDVTISLQYTIISNPQTQTHTFSNNTYTHTHTHTHSVTQHTHTLSHTIHICTQSQHMHSITHTKSHHTTPHICLCSHMRKPKYQTPKIIKKHNRAATLERFAASEYFGDFL